MEKSPLAVICVGSFLLLANAFDPIQTCLHVSLRSFSHNSELKQWPRFPLQLLSLLSAECFSCAKEQSSLTARGVETMSQLNGDILEAPVISA